MKLLVPVDGSHASMEAAKKSLEIAQKYGFSIKIISVVQSMDFDKDLNELTAIGEKHNQLTYRGYLNMQDELIAKMKESRFKLLDSITAELDFSGIDIEKEVLVGQPYLEILNTAKDENFDLIVIGNRGFSKIKRFFLGSVAQRVISEASCPVLVIHTDIDV